MIVMDSMIGEKSSYLAYKNQVAKEGNLNVLNKIRDVYRQQKDIPDIKTSLNERIKEIDRSINNWELGAMVAICLIVTILFSMVCYESISMLNAEKQVHLQRLAKLSQIEKQLPSQLAELQSQSPQIVESPSDLEEIEAATCATYNESPEREYEALLSTTALNLAAMRHNIKNIASENAFEDVGEQVGFESLHLRKQIAEKLQHMPVLDRIGELQKHCTDLESLKKFLDSLE